jgi:two-component system cell cycle response regulator
MRVLVAEDDLTSRLVLQNNMAKWGYEVLAVSDGERAWEELQKPDAPALRVLDWEMPGIDGIDLCRMVRAAESSHPSYIILLTSRSDTEDLVAGLEAGANDYVGKPFVAAELRARVDVGRRFVELHEQLRASELALEHLACTDLLTQIMNRGAIMGRLHEEVARSKREGSTLTVGELDIDYFKRVNDVHGHGAGDEVLREVVRRLTVAFRPYDGIGRIGGEEFLVLIPGAASDNARTVLDRLRRAVCATAIAHEDGQIDVTISLGGTTTRGDEPEDQVLMRADDALYRAKELGRNRVEMADGMHPEAESPEQR